MLPTNSTLRPMKSLAATIEYQLPLPTGMRDYETTIATIGPDEVIITARNVTARRRALEELRRSDARYRDLFNNATDMIITHDLKGRFTSANAAALKTYGYSAEETAGLTFPELVHSDHGAIVAARLHQSSNGGRCWMPPPRDS